MKAKRVVLFLFCIAILCSLIGCSSKTAQTVEGFTDFMETAGFEVTDATADTETNALASAVIIALCENYQIEFYQLIDNETGKAVFYNNKSIFDKEHSIKTMSVQSSFGNYDYYAFTADGNFHIIARIDSTMLYCEADKEYKDEIVKYVKELGYK